MGVRSKKRRCYSFLTNFTAAVLVIITFYLVALLKKQKVISNSKKDEKDENQDNSKLFMTFGIVLIISVMNGALRFVLSLMSNFEKKHSETERLQSAINKMWVVQYVNGALLLVLIASKHSKVFQTFDSRERGNKWIPILAGDYSDFDYPWYNEIG